MTQMTIAPDDRADIASLAGTVVSLLNGRLGERVVKREGTATRYLLEAARAPGFSPSDVLARLRALPLPDTSLLGTCIPEAARTLGALWLSDELGFASVSIATSRLQGLVAQMAPPAISETRYGTETRSALLILPPGETHTLGIHVAAAQLRRHGLSVRLMFGPDEATFLSTLQKDPYDLIMFACPRPELLAFVTRLVSVLRNTSASAGLTVLGGAVLDRQDNLTQFTGVDLVTNDIRAALLRQEALAAGTIMVR
ncbi:regulatory protein [Roseivivax halodurans JCM 10272]|uniref:Regulatory protein n=2 Tax=Roseivivax halodurans TaxID=93683 RepID=X7EIN0_9RHOB|nr:regulatory protein [Roseivivax halodurans JCM 10272]